MINSHMKDPINLRELFADRYRIVLDESAFCEEGGKLNPWYFQIPCKYGHFYLHSEQQIGFYCKGSRIRSKLHGEHPELETLQWSNDGEAMFLFTPEQFDVVAKYAKPMRKRGPRRLSDDHRDKLAKASRVHRFTSDSMVNNGSLEGRHATISTSVSDNWTRNMTRSVFKALAANNVSLERGLWNALNWITKPPCCVKDMIQRNHRQQGLR